MAKGGRSTTREATPNRPPLGSVDVSHVTDNTPDTDIVECNCREEGCQACDDNFVPLTPFQRRVYDEVNETVRTIFSRFTRTTPSLLTYHHAISLIVPNLP